MIYQNLNIGEDEFSYNKTANGLDFPTHLHRSYEFLYVIDGEITARVDEKEYSIKKGESILIFPHQYHSYTTKLKSQRILFIFSPNLVSSFYNKTSNLIPTDNKYTIENFEKIYSSICETENKPNKYLLKSILYLICGEFITQKTLIQSQNDSKLLIDNILSYIAKKFKEDCTLKEISQELNYDCYYLSRIFHKNLGMTFSEFLNSYRISYAIELLENTQLSITEISQQCGYATIRTFNREFLKICGKNPKSIRN